jgi:hypothetical protein
MNRSRPEGGCTIFDLFPVHDALDQLSARTEPDLSVALALDGGMHVVLSRAGTADGHAAGRNGTATNGHLPSNHHHSNGQVILHPPHANGVNGKAHHPAARTGRLGVETQP